MSISHLSAQNSLCTISHFLYCSLHATAEHATAAALPSLRLALHLLADLDVDLEELGNTAVEAHGLALVEVGFAVR